MHNTIVKSTLYSLRIVILLATISLFFSCTAYFNTFYNAEESFKEAQVIHLKLMRAYPESLLVTPPADVISKYDRTIEKSNKAIETFEKNKKWHDDALFLMGKAYFFKRELEKSIRRFRQLEQEFPDSKLIPEAQVYLGKAYIEEGDLDKAEELLLAAEKRFPELNQNQEISLLMITIAIRRNGKSQAIALLEETLKSIRSDEVRLDLFLQTAELYIELKHYENAILLLKRAPRKNDLPVHSYRIDRALLVCYKEINQFAPALELVNRMIANRTYSIYMDEMLYHKGSIEFLRGNLDEAIKIFKKLTSGVDSTSIVSDTSSFKAKALFDLALIYQKKKEDYTKAHHYYKLVASARDTTSNKPAKRYLSAMDRLKKLRDGTEKIDSIHGSSTFAIGELFRFELDEPDSAYLQFIRMSSDTGIDTSFIPKALVQAALLTRDALGDKKKSDSLFLVIIKRYPATDYAKIAEREYNGKITIATRQDSAQELYRKAERLFYYDNDVKAAIQQFFDLSKLYPEQSIAPKSLFAAAWFTSAVLQKNITAKMLYEKICEKYPESIYCKEQAKPRLKAVADTLAKLDVLRRENDKKRQQKKTTERSVDNAQKDKITTDTSTTDILSDSLLKTENSILTPTTTTASESFIAAKTTIIPVGTPTDTAAEKVPQLK